jgi:hypothetical protein
MMRSNVLIYAVAALCLPACDCSDKGESCFESIDCRDGLECCRPYGRPVGVGGSCVEDATSCLPYQCETDSDCSEGVCCPHVSGIGTLCQPPVVALETPCGACREDADCGDGRVCCPTESDGTYCVAGDSCDMPPGGDPPATPIDSATAPERPTTGAVEATAAAGQSLAPIDLAIVPGDGNIVVHELATGEVLQTLEPQPGQYAALLVTDGAGGDYMVNIGSDGALVRGWTGDQFSLFGQVLYVDGAHNVTDISPIGAARPAASAVLTDNSSSAIELLTYDTGVPGWTRTRPTSIPQAGGGSAVSAVAPSGESPVLVAVDGTPGNLWWVDWSVSPATMTDLGALGDAPRLIGCAPDGSVCLVPSYGSSTVTPVDTSTATPTVGAPIAVGTGPVSVSVTELDGTVVAVTTGFGDDSLTYLVRESGGGFRSETETLTDCSQPGHAVWVADRDWVLISCNGDDSFVIRTPPDTVP